MIQGHWNLHLFQVNIKSNTGPFRGPSVSSIQPDFQNNSTHNIKHRLACVQQSPKTQDKSIEAFGFKSHFSTSPH